MLESRTERSRRRVSQRTFHSTTSRARDGHPSRLRVAHDALGIAGQVAACSGGLSLRGDVVGFLAAGRDVEVNGAVFEDFDHGCVGLWYGWVGRVKRYM